MLSYDTFGMIFKRYTSAFASQPHLFGLLEPSSLSFLVNSSEDFYIVEGLDGESHENVSRCHEVRSDK